MIIIQNKSLFFFINQISRKKKAVMSFENKRIHEVLFFYIFIKENTCLNKYDICKLRLRDKIYRKLCTVKH